MGESNFLEPLCSERHPVSKRWVVFEDNGVSAWLYLTDSQTTRPVADCWVYNRIPAPPCHEIGKYHGGPPPACQDFVQANTYYQGPEPPNVEFQWTRDGESVVVLINGVALGGIVEAKGPGEGYSRYLSKRGAWGIPWDQELIRYVFEADL